MEVATRKNLKITTVLVGGTNPFIAVASRTSERRLLLGKITVDRGHSVPRMGAAASTSLEGGRSDTTISSASCLLKQTSGLKELNRHFAQLGRNFVVESEGSRRSFCETSAAESGNCVARL